jgi:hypothetical protein
MPRANVAMIQPAASSAAYLSARCAFSLSGKSTFVGIGLVLGLMLAATACWAEAKSSFRPRGASKLLIFTQEPKQQEPKQKMLGVDALRPKVAGLVPGEEDYSACAFCVSFKHAWLEVLQPRFWIIL